MRSDIFIHTFYVDVDPWQLLVLAAVIGIVAASVVVILRERRKS